MVVPSPGGRGGGSLRTHWVCVMHQAPRRADTMEPAKRRQQQGTGGRSRLMRAARCALETLEARQLLAGNEPFINEFLANNDTGLADDYGVRSDWIELYNPASTPASLTDWHLTDNKSRPAKWTFPPGTSIPGQGYLVVFASGRTTPIGPLGRLHAEFSLSEEGEYLALTRPDNTVASAFDPEFPNQLDDYSYGMTPATGAVTVVGPGAGSRTLIPTGNIGPQWTTTSFNDSSWIPGTTGVGFERVSVQGFRTRMVDT